MPETRNETDDTTQGWGWPANSRKAHYLVNSTALCRRWAFAGHLEQGNNDSPDNCAACKKALKRLEE